MTGKHTDDPAEHKHPQHPQVAHRAFEEGKVPFGQKVVQMDAHLAHMVGAEGGCHRDTFRLPEGVVLHRADKIDGNLRNLKGSGVRDES